MYMYFVFQYWNRLSSLQRSVICVILILGTVSFVYLLPSIYNGGNDEVDYFSRKRQVHVDAFDQSKGLTADVDKKFAQQAIDSIKKKANEYIKDKGVSLHEKCSMLSRCQSNIQSCMFM